MNVHKAYREDAVRGATPVGLVVLLYEQAIQDLQRALAAIRENDIARRTCEIDHAIRVLGQLQGTLNKEKGGAVAKNLERFYQVAVASLVTAQVQASSELIHKRIADLLELREAWIEVDRQVAPSEAAMALEAPSVLASSSKEPRRDWSG